jgi:hypothetical protein
MRRSIWAKSLAPTMAAIFLAAGCQQFFTYSLAKPLARTNVTVPTNLTGQQAADIAAEVKSNQDAALAGRLVTSLNTQIAATTDPTKKAELQTAAASAAVVASGASSTVLEALDIFLNTPAGSTPVIDTATISSMVEAIQAGGSADVLAAIAYLDPGSGLDPATVDTSMVSATDYVLGAIVLAAKALPPGVTDPTTMDAGQLSAYQADTRVVLAMDIIDGAAAIVTAQGGDPAMIDLLTQFMNL